jgi:hypothetical protein
MTIQSTALRTAKNNLPPTAIQTTVTKRRRGRPSNAEKAAAAKAAAATAEKEVSPVAVDPIQADIEAYRTLQLKIAALSEQMDPIKTRLTRHLQVHELDSMATTDGSYVIKLRMRTSWEYSNDLKIKLEHLKVDQKAEQFDGSATPTIKAYIEGRPAK